MNFHANPAALSILRAPVLPAVILLFGMTFCMAFAHIAGVPWLSYYTVALFSITLVWLLLLAWEQREVFKNFILIDILFGMFVLIVLLSAAISHGAPQEAVRKFLHYLPFMMVAPYIAGRLMRNADINLLSRITLLLGLAMLPLLVVDVLSSQNQDAGRIAFFGHNHSPLLIGCMLAATLISLCARSLASLDERNESILKQVIHYGIIGVIAVTLVWMKARGWVIAGLAGVGVVTWLAWNRKLRFRLGLFFYVTALVAITFAFMPRADVNFYAQLLMTPMSPTTVTPIPLIQNQPILGEASCKPFVEGVNSTAMRWVLYQEAAAIFMVNPVFGVGAARFGEQSCTGQGGFPHSTILQGFAELGLVGGCLLLGLISVALITLVRRCISDRFRKDGFEARFVLALFSAFLLADQIYGNYFMMVGTCLILGVAARMFAEEKKEDSEHG